MNYWTNRILQYIEAGRLFEPVQMERMHVYLHNLFDIRPFWLTASNNSSWDKVINSCTSINGEISRLERKTFLHPLLSLCIQLFIFSLVSMPSYGIFICKRYRVSISTWHYRSNNSNSNIYYRSLFHGNVANSKAVATAGNLTTFTIQRLLTDNNAFPLLVKI